MWYRNDLVSLRVGLMIAVSVARIAGAQDNPDDSSFRHRASDAARRSVRFDITMNTQRSGSLAADSAALARADTGRMTMGYHDFSAYTTPAMCLRAVSNARRTAWRDGAHDTAAVAWTPEHDTLPTIAVRVARTCAAKFSVATTPVEQLRSLQTLTLAAGDDATARAAVARLIASAHTPLERKGALIDAFDGFTMGRRSGAGTPGLFSLIAEQSQVGGEASVKPVRMADALHVLASLDSMGHDALLERAWIHQSLLQYYSTLFDTTAMAREIAVIKKLRPLFDSTDAVWHDRFAAGLLTTAGLEITLQIFRDGTERYPEILRNTVVRECAEIRTAMPQEWVAAMKGCTAPGPAYDFLLGLVAPQLEKRSPIIRSNYWFNAGASTVRPAAGKVNYVVELFENGVGAPNMRTTISFLKRLHEKYASAGLEITVVQSTHGALWGSGVLSPEQEANTFAWYYLDYWKMPVTLAVVETPFTRDAEGHRVAGISPIKGQFPPIANHIIGRDGRIISPNIVYSSDFAIEAFIRQALGLTGTR